MRTIRASLIAVCASFALLAPAAYADSQTDHLRDLAKQAHAQGALDEEADYLCQAATLDPQKYGKKCERTRADVTRQLDEFKGLLGTGQFELQHKDYQGAIRDLSKIRFGQLTQQAQALVAQAKRALAQSPADAAAGGCREGDASIRGVVTGMEAIIGLLMFSWQMSVSSVSGVPCMAHMAHRWLQPPDRQ